jgi:hypothetical protein
MKNTKKFFVVVTSLMLVFAMIGCDQGTKVEYRDRVVGGGSNPGSSDTRSDKQKLEDALEAAATENKPYLLTGAVTLDSELILQENQKLVVGASSYTPPSMSVNGLDADVSEGPLFSDVTSSSGTLNIKKGLIIRKGASLTVLGGAVVNVNGGNLVVESGASVGIGVDVSQAGGTLTHATGGLAASQLYIAGGAKAEFASNAVLAVAAVPESVVLETATSGLTLASGAKLAVVTPEDGEATDSVIGTDTANAVIVVQENAVAVAIAEVDVYTDAGDALSDAAANDGAGSSSKAETPGTGSLADTVKDEAAEVSKPVFNRTANAGTYVITGLDGDKVKLKAVSDDEEEEYTVLDSGILKIFNAVYTPNAPDTSDSFVPLEAGQGKHTVAYTADVSAAVLGLFHITIGDTGADDLIEIKGSMDDTLFTETATADNILVIDIGLPGTVDNSGLKYFIPYKGLGELDAEEPTEEDPEEINETFGGVRLRVNKGAYLVIDANNDESETGYVTLGAGHPCATGKFNGGCVEVMDGGKLRDSAYEGYPLGDDATITLRYGSTIVIGKEGNADGLTTAAYDAYFKDNLIGPAGAKIEWDAGQPNAFIEIRPGELVLSAKVTVKKLTGIIYSVWFVDTTVGSLKTEAGLTIDATDAATTGLFAANDTANKFKFYGQSTTPHTIIVKNGSISKSFLQSATTTDLITKASAEITITNEGTGEGNTVIEKAATKFSNIKGYLNWAPLGDEG